MSQKSKKQFGVWLDTQHATIIGKTDADAEFFSVLGVADNTNSSSSSSEKTANNSEITLQHKYFKEILNLMTNAEEVHITGTGTSQEQLMRYMSETPQFKNTKTKDSTSIKMTDDKLTEYIAAQFN